MKRIAILILVMAMALCSCSSDSPQIAELQSRIETLEQENRDLKAQLKIGSGNDSSASTTQPSTNDDSQSLSDALNEDKFKGITVTVTEKNFLGREQGYVQDFIEMVYDVKNDTTKDIKGIEGLMHINDMFGKTIMKLNWDILDPIPANSSETFKGNGINFNQFMDDHAKLKTTPFDSLIFEYEIKTVMFADGSTIN